MAKYTLAFLALLTCGSAAVSAPKDASGNGGTESDPLTPPGLEGSRRFTVVRRDADSDTVESVITRQIGSRTVYQTNTYQACATGRNYQEGGIWKPSSDQIEILPDGGGQASHARHQVYFPGDLYEGSLNVRMPDGKTIGTRPIGLAYSDGEQTAWIAQLKSGFHGELLPSGNQVLYRDVCDNAKLDLLCTMRRAGFESDLVIREQLPEPALFNFSKPENLWLQWWTELASTAEPVLKRSTTKDGSENVVVDLGTMRMPRGRSFMIGSGPASGEEIPVLKSVVKSGGRTFLVEQVRLKSVMAALSQLPRGQAQEVPRAQPGKFNAKNRALPPARSFRKSGANLLIAGAGYREKPGYVIDYSIVHGTTTSAYEFLPQTCYIDDLFIVSDADIVFDGGAVLKFATNGCIQLNGGEGGGAVKFKSGPTRMVTFTSKDDNTVGDTVAGSTGAPLPNAGNPMLDIYSYDVAVKYAHFGYANTAVRIQSDFYDLTFDDVQVVNCNTAFKALDSFYKFRNILLYNIASNCFEGDLFYSACEHLTAHNCGALVFNSNTNNDYTFSLTNSLIVQVTNASNIPITTNNTVILASDAGIFQTAGSGSHYLADGSPYRDAGTTNISPSLLAELKQKTTYPPILFTNQFITSNLVLSPQAGRDVSKPDLGWHYCAADWAFKQVPITNATIKILPGTTIIVGGSWGFSALSGATVDAEGTPENPVRIMRYNMVQEHSTAIWDSVGPSIPGKYIAGPAPGTLKFRFVDFSMPGMSPPQYENFWYDTDVSIRDCQFHGGGIHPYLPGITVTNTLFEYCHNIIDDTSIGEDVSPIIQNCLFYGGTLILAHWNADNWTFRDNVFDHCTLSLDGTWDDDYSGYATGSDVLTSGRSHDVTGTLTWVSGPLGEYYQPTNSLLIDKGHITADLVGLYHFTTTTNLVSGYEVPEGSTTNDLGFHYVAGNADGLAHDTDGDGKADVREDANGNGVVESGETAWQGATDLGLKVFITSPRTGSSLP